MKKINISLRLIIAVFCVVLAVSLPLISLKVSDEISLIYKTFIGNKSEYQGMIEIWNIDTFESGSASKVSFLEERAKSFQKKNKGLHFMIRNITETECVNMLKNGQNPDLFSCSYGVSQQVKDYVMSFENKEINIYDNFKKAGMLGDSLYGLAWCTGFYCLISTKQKMEKAGFEGEISLKEKVYSASYKFKSGKKEKVSSSLTYGSNKYLMPKNAILSYNTNSIVQTENSIDAKAGSQTQYSAYCKFLTDDATILLGTQRDILRIENRAKQGKVSDVIFEPAFGYTDLVQFMFLGKIEDNLRKKYAEEFAFFLVSDESQSSLENIGMFAVKQLNSVSFLGVMKDIALGKISDCKLFGVFDSVSEFE